MIQRRLFIAMAAMAVAAGAWAQSSPAPQPLIYYAGAAGRLTQDRDRLGGNPFASALVEVLREAPLTLADFGARMSAANAKHSGGWQQLQMPKTLPDPKLRLDGDKGSKRIALVLINADYSKSDGVYSLPGAAFDAKRVPAALREAGFETTLVLDASADMARRAIAEFAAQSAAADMSRDLCRRARYPAPARGLLDDGRLSRAGCEMAADSRDPARRDWQGGAGAKRERCSLRKLPGRSFPEQVRADD